MTDPAIAANGLRKSYGDKVVLDGIDLTVPEGTIFSLLGPNGSRQDHPRTLPLHPRRAGHAATPPSRATTWSSSPASCAASSD